MVLAICPAQPGNADLVLPQFTEATTGYGAVKNWVRQGELAAARRELNSLAAEQVDTQHPELQLAQILIDQGAGAAATRVLEEFSKDSAHEFEASLAFARIAVQQSRWFDGWTHLAVAEKAAMPERWSQEYQQQIRGELQLLRALCNEGRSDWSGARDAYRSAASIGMEKDARVLIGLGRAEFHLGNIDAACTAFRTLRSGDPSAAAAEVYIAQLYEIQGEEESVEQWYRKAILLPEEEATDAKLKFARWLIWHNRPAEAKETLAAPAGSAEAEVGEAPQERIYLEALVARMEKRFDDAQSILSELHQQQPAAFAVSNQLALVLIESTDETARGRALQIAEANVRNHQQLAEAWSTLGWVQLRLGDTAAAQKSLALATQSGQVTRDTAHFIAELQEVAGEPLAALEFRNAATQAKGPSFYTSAGK